MSNPNDKNHKEIKDVSYISSTQLNHHIVKITFIGPQDIEENFPKKQADYGVYLTFEDVDW